jgi:hypothetical protein
MSCGCKKKAAVPQPNPQTVNINGVSTPVVTQPAPILQMMDLVNKTDNTNNQ